MDEELVSARRPSDVVDAAGAWIGNTLTAHGFRWLATRRSVQRVVGGLVQEIVLQPSSSNRVGKVISISTHVSVRDPELRLWRMARRHLVVPPSESDLVCGHLLGYASGRANGYLYGDARDGDLDLTEPAVRAERLARFVDMVQLAVLPWFAEACEPDSIVVSRAGDYSLPFTVMEWLASRNRLDLVRGYAERYLSRHADTQQRFARGSLAASAGRPSPPVDDLAAVAGWSITMLTQAPASGA
jgi:hypothetical protein